MKHVFLTISLCAVASVAMAQSFTVYEKEKESAYNVEDVDSIVFSPEHAQAAAATPEPRVVNGTWCSLGTSISWLNENTASYPLTKGYQTRVMEKLAFTGFINNAVNGGLLESALSKVTTADYFTIEHGINDWGKEHITPVGTIDDYINNTRNGTFAANYRKLIDRIFSRNKNNVRIILCTPRKAYGFNGYLPDHWYDPQIDANGNEVYLEEYAKLIRQIAAYESFPVADFFAEAGGQRQLKNWSYDTALHPNDEGMQVMANILIQAFEKILGE